MKKILLLVLMGAMFVAPSVLAQGAQDVRRLDNEIAENASGKLINPLKVDSVEGFLLAVIDVMLTFALPIVVLFLMWTGFLMVMAQGDPGKLTAAKKRFLNVLVGTLIIFGAKLILEIIQTTIKSF